MSDAVPQLCTAISYNSLHYAHHPEKILPSNLVEDSALQTKTQLQSEMYVTV